MILIEYLHFARDFKDLLNDALAIYEKKYPSVSKWLLLSSVNACSNQQHCWCPQRTHCLGIFSRGIERIRFLSHRNAPSWCRTFVSLAAGLPRMVWGIWPTWNFAGRMHTSNQPPVCSDVAHIWWFSIQDKTISSALIWHHTPANGVYLIDGASAPVSARAYEYRAKVVVQ